jgi:RimJ/RimL family protein N-acetyltransferase
VAESCLIEPHRESDVDRVFGSIARNQSPAELLAMQKVENSNPFSRFVPARRPRPPLNVREKQMSGCDDCAAMTISGPIQTNRLLLRPFTDDDLDGLHALQSHPDVVRYLFWNKRSREEVAVALRERLACTRLEEDGDAIVLAVERRSDTRLIGDVTLWLRSIEHRQCEIGFVFHPDGQGQGFGTEAAREMLRFAFEELEAHRVYGRTDARNSASAALMGRLGMRQEAHFRHNEIFKGDWGDELVFAILEEEWRSQS